MLHLCYILPKKLNSHFLVAIMKMGKGIGSLVKVFDLNQPILPHPFREEKEEEKGLKKSC